VGGGGNTKNKNSSQVGGGCQQNPLGGEPPKANGSTKSNPQRGRGPQKTRKKERRVEKINFPLDKGVVPEWYHSVAQEREKDWGGKGAGTLPPPLGNPGKTLKGGASGVGKNARQKLLLVESGPQATRGGGEQEWALQIQWERKGTKEDKRKKSSTPKRGGAGSQISGGLGENANGCGGNFFGCANTSTTHKEKGGRRRKN